jgi:ABC-type dipeptide/oligopeptide/nickel transport system permease component
MAMFLVASLSVIVANLLTDIAYTALDPRVRLT